MSIFGSMLSKIFGHSQAAQPDATTAGGAAKMALGSILVVLGMAFTGGRESNLGANLLQSLQSGIEAAGQDVNAPAGARPLAAPAPQPQPVVPPPQIQQANIGNAPAVEPAFPLYDAGVQGAHMAYEVRQAMPHVVNAVHRADQGIQRVEQVVQQAAPRVNVALDQVGEAAGTVSRFGRAAHIWFYRGLGFAALLAGIRFCWQGGQKLKSMLSFHGRSDELEHYKDVIVQLLHREDLILGTQNSDGETALSLVRKHMANSTRDREAYQLFADIEQLILIRGA